MMAGDANYTLSELIPPVGLEDGKNGTLVQYLPQEETADLPRVSIYLALARSPRTAGLTVAEIV